MTVLCPETEPQTLFSRWRREVRDKRVKARSRRIALSSSSSLGLHSRTLSLSLIELLFLSSAALISALVLSLDRFGLLCLPRYQRERDREKELKELTDVQQKQFPPRTNRAQSERSRTDRQASFTPLDRILREEDTLVQFSAQISVREKKVQCVRKK